MRKISGRLIGVVLLVLLGCQVAWAQAGPARPAAPAAPAATPAAAPAPAAQAGQITVKDIVIWGGTIGYIIIFLSIVTVALVAVHFLVLRRTKLCPVTVEKKLGGLFQEKKVDEAIEYARKDPSLLARIIGGGLSRMSGGYGEMEQVMNDVAEDEAMRLEQGVGYFALVAAVAPLLGLLGTVVGMIFAFNEIANRGVVTPKELADPIQKALVTTFFGLMVAIPNVVAYTYFRNKLHRMLADLALVTEELMMPFRNLKPATERTPAAASATPKTPAEKP